jgi:glycosyltransferase involved in cell wall biosynthesis
MAGCEKRFFEIGKRLSRRGHDVHVFTLQHEPSLPREETVEGMTVHRCGYSGTYVLPNGLRSLTGVLKYSLATPWKLLGKDFDIFYSNEWPMLHSIFVKPVARPLIQEWCEVWNDSSKIAIMQRALKWIGDYHVAVSDFTKRRVIDVLGIDSTKVSLVPNGVDVSKFHNNQNKPMSRRIIYVGRLVPHKHVEMLIDAFGQVKKKIKDAQLHIVGSGPSLFSLKQRASRTKDCFIHGFLPEDQMLSLLKDATVFVLPSEREGSGIAMLEAMASGLPFVTVNYPDNGAKDLAKLKCGLVVDPDDDSIASAILQLVSDEEMYRQMSHNALNYAKEQDWNIVADQMENLMNKVA